MDALSRSEVQGDVYFITRDCDLGASEGFRDVPIGRWHPHGRAKVVYLPSRRIASVVKAIRMVREVKPQTLYLNSLFSPFAGLLPLVLWRIGLLPSARLVLAPRGELEAGALRIARLKKAVALSLIKRLGLSRRVRWHATSEMELESIRRMFGPQSQVELLVASRPVCFAQARTLAPQSPLRLVYASRITPKKGLLLALAALSNVSSPVSLRIAGPSDDKTYLQRCERAISMLPARHRASLLGCLSHDQVSVELAAADGFILPTQGENFGHAILEALAAGCPVIVGEATPWADVIRAGAGWVVEEDQMSVAAAIESLASASQDRMQELSGRAVDAARAFCSTAANGSGWDRLFWG